MAWLEPVRTCLLSELVGFKHVGLRRAGAPLRLLSELVGFKPGSSNLTSRSSLGLLSELVGFKLAWPGLIMYRAGAFYLN